MQTLFQVTGQQLNNRNISFSNRQATLSAGSVILFRLRVTALNPDASLNVSMDVTFPGGIVKHFDLNANQLGPYQRGGWAGVERGGIITASGLVDAVSRVTFDAAVVVFEQGEDVPEWS